MSVKAVKKYYAQICEQYKEMLENLHDLEHEVENGVIEPERLDRLKDQVAPIKQNYERWAYMMYLLNEPNRANKKKLYEKRNKKLLSTLSKNNSLESVLNENSEAMKHIGE